jgi:3-oxoacyl-[acyl-carrier protein] reductase
MDWWEKRAGLRDTVVVITGGAGGLGEAVSLDLAANGVKVAIVDRDAAAVEKIRAALEASGADAITHVGDARDRAVLETLFAASNERWGRLDGLVNVVGGTFRAAFTETNERGWDALIRTNLDHVLHACSIAIPLMRAGGRGGSIVNLTTVEAHRAAPNFAVYSAAKAAVAHFARSLAVELAPEGIRVNNVAPDITPTAGMQGISPVGGSFIDPLGAKIAIPMGRVGIPSDVSSSVVFLLSNMASYITGSTLHPDGGTFSASGWFNWPGSGFGNTIPTELMPAMHEANQIF